MVAWFPFPSTWSTLHLTTSSPTASIFTILLLTGGPGSNIDFSRFSFHVPMKGLSSARADLASVNVNRTTPRVPRDPTIVLNIEPPSLLGLQFHNQTVRVPKPDHVLVVVRSNLDSQLLEPFRHNA